MKRNVNRVKELVKNFVTSGMHEDYDVEAMRKVMMINVVSVIGIANLVPLGVLSFFQGNATLCFCDLVVATALVVNVLYLRKSRRYNVASYFGVSVAGALFLYLFATGGQNNTGHLWYYTFPLFVSFLLGSKRGALASLILLFPAILVFSKSDVFPSLAIYSTDFKIRFIPSFLVVLGYSYLFERIREKTQQKLALKNAELEESITELEKTGTALRSARDGLEQRVIERTAELTKTNEQLKEEIKERLRGETALLDSEERYRSFVENIDLGVTLIDSAHNIVHINKAHSRMYDKPVSAFLGKKCFREFQQQESVCSHCPGVRAMNTGRAARIETEGVRDDGTSFTAIVHAFPTVGPDSEVKGFMEVVEDITERKRLEAQLQRAQKMESIGTLAGGIAHDFNNLLMGIQGHASLMLLHIDAKHPLMTHLSGIEDMVQRGSGLTRQLLGFAKAGKYEVKGLDLNRLVEETSEMFGQTKKEIHVHKKYQKEIWPVEADETQIEQVLVNLYVNSWQAMPDGGNLYVETRNVALDEEQTGPFDMKSGNYVKISVTDTGIGMDRAIQERVFDPFFTTKEMERGTGLGLSSAYGIIKNHGGIIHVDSEEGKGSTFSIYLPASEKEVAVREERLADGILRGVETILLVDDEDIILDVGKQMLKEMGYEVLAARDGKEAVDVYRENRDGIDLVILDMIMPGMSGREAYDRMKENDPSLRVLLSSGYSIDGKAAEILERGCDGFIQKPFNIRELSKKIRGILDNK